MSSFSDQQLGIALFVSHDTSMTGGSIFLLRFLRWLRENSDLNFRVLAGSRGETYSDFEALCPVDSFEPELDLGYRIRRKLKRHGSCREDHLSTLRQKLRGLDVRLIYANTVATGGILEFLSFVKCPVVCHVHELEATITELGLRNMEQVRNRAADYIAVSEAVRKNLVRRHAISPNIIQTIHGFVPPAQNTRSHSEMRNAVFSELRIPAAAKLVCACGATGARKGTDIFLKVAEQVTRGFEPGAVHFLWVGGRPELATELNRQVESSALRRAVHFIGPRSNIVPYYAASDVFLLPSREDPFPLVMMEAAQEGKPTVCFGDAGGAPEFVEQDAGFVIPNFDANAMAERVNFLLTSPEVTARMGENARNKVISRYSLAVGAPKLKKIIFDRMGARASHEFAVRT